MLSLQDCIGFSGLTPEQLEAIADHEHLELIIAAEWAEQTLDRSDGEELVEQMLTEEVAYCASHHKTDRLRRYMTGLTDFHRQHPPK
ncbi:MAG TPA: hypothetical protein VM661_12885 [Candidatus Sulfotelmatobacter sp.]|jgi:hypothetical protein|nr:hypothetical protein [Candidatus Sulfotelmatobacter sp.]